MTLELSIIDDARELERYRSEWTDLLSKSETAAPTLTPDWILSWWQVFGASGGRGLRVGLFHEDGRLVGLAPFLMRRHWYRPWIPFRRLELLGTGEPEADEICSEYVGVLVERGFEDAVARALAHALKYGGFGTWDELVMPAMNGEARLPVLLGRRLVSLGIPCTTSVTTRSAYIPLPSTWQEYLAALSGSHRARLKRALRAFDVWSGGDERIETVTRPDQLERGFSILRSLHAERWGRLRAGGLFASTRFRSFHESIMPKLLASQMLELSWLSVRGEPIAVLYNVTHDGKVYFYQAGRKLDLPRSIRPGIVLHARAIERAIANGRTEYDFLGGTQRYKRELALACRPIVELRAVRPALIELLRRAAAFGVEQTRALRIQLDGLRCPEPRAS